MLYDDTDVQVIIYQISEVNRRKGMISYERSLLGYHHLLAF